MTDSPIQEGGEGLRVLICGGRDFQDYRYFARMVAQTQMGRRPFAEIIHGGAKGADWCAHLLANSAIRRIERVFPADWKAHGKAAGPKRNQRMIDEGKPDLVIAFPGGRGTADMVRRAKAAGIEVIPIPHPEESIDG